MDARPANADFREPPGVALASAETFSKIEVDFGMCGSGQVDYPDFPFGLHVGLSDVKDCFHRIRQPRWLARYFCLMPIEARHVGLTGKSIDGQVLQSSDLVYPMPGSLCMGFSWSLYFAQKISERQMSLVPTLKDSTLVNDRSGPAVFSAEAPSSLKHFVYVDNLGVMSGNAECVAQGLSGLTEQFTDQKLLLHPGEIQHSKIAALGIEMNGQKLTTSVASARLHRVRQGLRHLLHRKRCTGRVLEILVGHCTYCGLVNRCTLSIFHNVYKFIKTSYSTSIPIWPSVMAELRAFVGLMPALRADWSRPWSDEVVVSDASEEGYGVCRAHWGTRAVAEVGRVSERDRFKRCGGHNARDSALSAAGFVRDEVTGKWSSGEIGDEEYLEASGWRLDSSFPEVPASDLKQSAWAVARQDRWKKAEHIIHLEARALVKSMETAVHDLGCFNARQLLLVDSMSVALAFDRCRSRNYRLLRQIRKFASFSLGCNIGFTVRWVPSEINPADEPSRVFPSPLKSCATAPVSLQDNSLSNGAQEDVSVSSSTAIFKEEGLPVTSPAVASDKQETKGASQKGQSGADETAKSSQVAEAFFDCKAGARSGAGDNFDWTEEKAFREPRQFLLNRGESPSEETAVAGQAKQETPEEVCGRDDGRQLTGPQSFGAQSHRGKVGEVLQPRVCGPSELCQLATPEVLDTLSERPGDQCLLQPPFPGRAPCSQGGEDSCGLHAPTLRLQPLWVTEIASDLSSLEGVETTQSRCFSKGLALSCLECSGLRDEAQWSAPDGPLHNVGSRLLCEAKRTLEVPCPIFGQTVTISHRSLVLATQPGRDAREVQGGGVRRLSCPRLSLSEALGASFVEAAGHQAPDFNALGLRLWSVHEGLQPDCATDVHRHHPVPAPPLRAKHRPKQEHSVAPRSAKARTMESPQECSQVREVRKISSQLPNNAFDSATALPRMRDTSRGCVARPGPSSPTAYTAKGLKGQYVADLFSGHGGVAKQCRQLGYITREWELARGIQFDLTKPAALRKLKQDINRCLVLAAMLAPPCSSFSVARDRTCVIRTKEHPWGLPKQFLSLVDQEKVRVGNNCFRAAIRIIRWLNEHSIPWILENPASSKCWYLPQLRKLENSPNCTVVISDFCQFGTLWRKRTKFLCGNLDTQDVARIGRLCQGRGTCDRTGRPHFQLTGSNHKGVPWTRIAQPYPAQLCKQLAFALTAPAHY